MEVVNVIKEDLWYQEDDTCLFGSFLENEKKKEVNITDVIKLVKNNTDTIIEIDPELLVAHKEILTKPEKINNDPTNILKILTKIFILLI